jgi:hypothetical protein
MQLTPVQYTTLYRLIIGIIENYADMISARAAERTPDDCCLFRIATLYDISLAINDFLIY